MAQSFSVAVPGITENKLGMHLGENQIKSIYLGNQNITSAYLGSNPIISVGLADTYTFYCELTYNTIPSLVYYSMDDYYTQPDNGEFTLLSYGSGNITATTGLYENEFEISCWITYGTNQCLSYSVLDSIITTSISNSYHSANGFQNTMQIVPLNAFIDYPAVTAKAVNRKIYKLIRYGTDVSETVGQYIWGNYNFHIDISQIAVNSSLTISNILKEIYKGSTSSGGSTVTKQENNMLTCIINLTTNTLQNYEGKYVRFSIIIETNNGLTIAINDSKLMGNELQYSATVQADSLYSSFVIKDMQLCIENDPTTQLYIKYGVNATTLYTAIPSSTLICNGDKILYVYEY